MLPCTDYDRIKRGNTSKTCKVYIEGDYFKENAEASREPILPVRRVGESENTRQHDRQATHAAVQEPTRTRRGSAWRSCQIPRERYPLAATLPIKFPAAELLNMRLSPPLPIKCPAAPLNMRLRPPLPIKFPAAAPLNMHLRPSCP